ncbi:MAG: rod shape-determining protein MreC [Legionellales bacterium RIFCSPHIGHO2_12_FULL_37_14]|nr:MAG: rod shape-determining protein MreC [Legionellales bacterium RIFCSPHIGHO2_12_FULL_37_14]
MQHKHKLFAQKKAPSWSFVLVFSLAVLLIYFDSHGKLTALRRNFSYIAAPFQYTVDYPQRLWRFIEALASSKNALVQENMQLRYQNTLLEAKLQHFLMVKRENLKLKALLKNKSQENTRAIAAQILDVEVSPVRQLMVLDKGWHQGIREGQAVLDAKGVMGQIINVGYSTSTVLLISDLKSAVPVQNSRTGEWAMLMGSNKVDKLALLNLPQTSSVKPGDLLVTSGLGGHYPQGYPIGKVIKLHHDESLPFLRVDVSPVAKLNKSNMVLVLLDEKEAPLVMQQIHARLNALGVLR